MRLVMYVLAVALLIIGSALATHAANVQDKGLILYFSFDEAKGGKLVDETGGGNDGEIVDGGTIDKNKGKYKGAMLFEKGAGQCDSRFLQRIRRLYGQLLSLLAQLYRSELRWLGSNHCEKSPRL